jgi:hypothetical protein
LTAETPTEMEKMSMLLRAVEAAPAVSAEPEPEANEPENTAPHVMQPQPKAQAESAPAATAEPAR